MIQFLTTDSGDELVVLSRPDYDALLARAGDPAAEDRAAAAIVRDTAGETALPEAVWERIEAGESPIRAVREHRGLTQADLAAAAGIAQGYVSGLEAGRRDGSAPTLRKIATALGVSLDVLVGEKEAAQIARRRADTAVVMQATLGAPAKAD